MLFLLTILRGSVRPADSEHTVCDVLGEIERLNGAIVVVKGSLVSDVDTWLIGDGCRKPVRVGKCSFDNLISVAWPDSRYVKRELKGRDLFPVDRAGREKLSLALSGEFSAARIEVAIEGLIVTRDPMSLLVHPKSPETPAGFGHLGAAPAMIVVKRVLAIGPPESRKPK